MVEKKYFITVDWCNQGKRGVFCSIDGIGYWKKIPHTEREMRKVLGHFWMILNPKSEAFTEKELENRRWVPLPEYRNEYGIAIVQRK